MYYVYVIERSDRSFYVGYSTNLKKRIIAHNKGKIYSTKFRLPIKLILYEAYLQKSDAKRRELYLKTSKGKTTLRTMLKDYLKSSSK